MLSADMSAADTHRAILAVWREFARLGQAVEAALKVLISAVYPLAETAKAHERLAAGHVLGKIVLSIRSRTPR
jgi:NADPH:quinone reductase-like Zn-dependent oxidoreductase